MQLNQRLIDSFQHTKVESDFIIFKKSLAERQIFKNFKRKDCLMEILKPNLGFFLIRDKETNIQYRKAAQAMSKKKFDEASKRLRDIMIGLRAPFRPGDLLQLQIDTKKKMHQMAMNKTRHHR